MPKCLVSSLLHLHVYHDSLTLCSLLLPYTASVVVTISHATQGVWECTKVCYKTQSTARGGTTDDSSAVHACTNNFQRQPKLVTASCPAAGDGDCGYRAVAVGLVIALRAHPNAPQAGLAFVQHMRSLCEQIPRAFLDAQEAGPPGGNACLGMAFFEVG